jgi:hypothetical protein
VLARLKRGIYLILPPYQKYLPDTFEIAQTLYGPSYISFESALSRHGLIPEAVYATASACIKRSTTFETFLGAFYYLPVPIKGFSLGIQRMEEDQSVYLLATPWKALADLCYVRHKEWKSLSDLCADLRIEKEDLLKQNPKILEELIEQYGSNRVSQVLSRMAR